MFDFFKYGLKSWNWFLFLKMVLRISWDWFEHQTDYVWIRIIFVSFSKKGFSSYFKVSAWILRPMTKLVYKGI